MDELLNAIASMIKIKQPSHHNNNTSENINEGNKITDDEAIELANKVINTYNSLTNSVMQLSDVTEDVVDKYLTAIYKQSTGIADVSVNMTTGSDAIVNSVENVANSFDNITRKVTSNINDLNSVAESVDMSKATDNITKSLSSATTKSTEIYKSFEDDFIQRVNRSAANRSFSKIGEMVSTFFAGIQDGLKAPFRFGADIINFPKQFSAGIRDTVKSLKSDYNSFKEAWNTGNWDSFLSEEPKNEKLQVGIADKTLNTEEVLRNSAVGVSVVWLAKTLLEKNSKEKLLNSNSANTGDNSLVDDIASNAVGTAIGKMPFSRMFSGALGKIGPAATTIASSPMTWLLGSGLLMYNNFSNRKNVEEIIDKERDDISLTDRGISTVSQTLFGNIGDGSPQDQSKNVLKGIATGALTGAAIGSVVPVIGTAVGALVGSGIGFVGNLIGGDRIAGSLIQAKDKLVDVFSDYNDVIKQTTDLKMSEMSEIENNKKNLLGFNDQILKSSENFERMNRNLNAGGIGWIPKLLGEEKDESIVAEPSKPKVFSPESFTFENVSALSKNQFNNYQKQLKGEVYDSPLPYQLDEKRFTEYARRYLLNRNKEYRNDPTKLNNRIEVLKGRANETLNSLIEVQQSDPRYKDIDVNYLFAQQMHETGLFNSDAMWNAHNTGGVKSLSDRTADKYGININRAVDMRSGKGDNYSIDKYTNFASLNDASKYALERALDYGYGANIKDARDYAEQLKRSNYYSDSIDNYARGLDTFVKLVKEKPQQAMVTDTVPVEVAKENPVQYDLGKDLFATESLLSEATLNRQTRMFEDNSAAIVEGLNANLSASNPNNTTQSANDGLQSVSNAAFPIVPSGSASPNIPGLIMNFMFGVNVGGVSDGLFNS